jgi:hypothetical protein
MNVRPPGIELQQLMVLMERPFFGLGKRRVEPLEYLSPDKSIHIQVHPRPDGMATIYDADLLMFLVKELADSPARTGATVILRAGAYLTAVGSTKGGDQYALLAKAIQRLSTTRITTNVQFDGKPGPIHTFAGIASAARQGNDWHITLPSGIAEGARSKFVLDICPEYFALGGFDRCLYLTGRKHVGRDRSKVFRIRVSTMWAKSGSGGKLSRFRHEFSNSIYLFSFLSSLFSSPYPSSSCRHSGTIPYKSTGCRTNDLFRVRVPSLGLPDGPHAQKRLLAT